MTKWTQKEEDYLKSNTSQTVEELALYLKRSEDAVSRKLRRLKITPIPNKKFDYENVVALHKKEMIEKNNKRLMKDLLAKETDKNIVLDILKEIVPVAEYKPIPYKKRCTNKNKEIFVMNIGDVHLGRYPYDVFVRKMEYLISSSLEILDIQRGKAQIDELVINFIGDIVDGDGIFPSQPYEQKFHLMEQMFSGYPVFVEMINKMSENFSKVTLNCVRGNHGRVSKFTDETLNFDSIFYHILEIATKNNDKLVWNISDKWYLMAKIYRYGFLLTHGNYIKTWLNIPFYGIKEKGMRWQGSLTKQETVQMNKDWVRIQKEYWDYIIMGHFHTSLYFRWNNWRCILNGTWLDHDDFSESVLGLDSATEQTIFGVHEKRGITWMRNLDLSEEQL